MTRGTLVRAGLAGAAATACVLALTAGAHDEDWRKLRDRMPPFEGPIVTLHDLAAAGVDSQFDALNMDLLSWIPLSEFPGGHSAGNDVWGYTSPSGREYAIMGLEKGYGFVEITDPTDPVLLSVVAGPASTWHDLKVIGHYAYGVSEAGRGVQIIDLARIDEGIVRHVKDHMIMGHSSSHNIVANEESGFLYIVGGNVASGGLWALDTNADPENPTFAGQWSDFYIHDAQVVTYTDGPYAGREIAFTFGGRSGGWSNTGLRIVDVTDKSNMFTISDAFWSQAGYAHQGWLTEDRKYLYIDDELDEEMGLVATTTTRIFDVSDLASPKFVRSFTTGLPSTDHNQYVKGDRLYQANYRSGVRVWDISDPVNPEEIAWIDTHPEGDHSGYTGVWSVFPYFDSGTIIASDMVRGLFVIKVASDGACRADLDGDGELTFFDFLAFQNLFAAGDLKADFDGDGQLTFFDFLAFQNEYAAGCP